MNAAWGDLEYLKQGLGEASQAAVDYIQKNRQAADQQEKWDAIEKSMRDSAPDVTATPGETVPSKLPVVGAPKVDTGTSMAPAQPAAPLFTEPMLQKMTMHGKPVDPTTDPRYRLMRSMRIDPARAFQFLHDYQQLVEGAGGAKFVTRTDPFTGAISADKTPLIPGENKPTHYATEVDKNGVTQNTAYYSDGSKRYLGQAPDSKPTLISGGVMEGGKNVPATLERDTTTGQWTVKPKQGELPPKSNAAGAQSSDPEDIANAIISGKQPPSLRSLYRNAAPVQAALGRKGYDLMTASKDWEAVTKHLATLNGAQQERLRQAITFTQHTLPQIEEAYGKWVSAGQTAGMKAFNKASLATSKQFGGEASSAAQNLESLIADFTSELGTVYKGGNSSTDESLELAAKNLSGDWNEKTFSDAISRLKRSLQIRYNSITTSQPMGVSQGSKYNVQPQQPSRVRVRRKIDGKTGTLEEKDFDASRYERIQ